MFALDCASIQNGKADRYDLQEDDASFDRNPVHYSA